MADDHNFVTPLTGTAASRLLQETPQDFISPASRHTLTSPVGNTLLAGVNENDDEAEKRERRRSRVLAMQQRTLQSPATPTDKRRSTPLSGLSNVQLTEHYTNCIKLSAENKINAKNAFGLHLIDYMSELIKKKEMNNFQVASSTLDASAKIYAGRVDAIHSETYKVLTGLGRGNEKQGKEDDDGYNSSEEATADGEPKKKKRARKSHTIETNLKNLNVNKFDLEFEVDPLFKKTSAAFDEGGAGGLLLNHLRSLNDMSELILDSNTIVTGHEDMESQPERGQLPVDLRDLKEMYNSVNLEPLHLCPSFSDFEFTNWKQEEGEDTFSTKFSKMVKPDHQFDLDAEPEPIGDETTPEDRISAENFVPFDDDYDGAVADHDVSDTSVALGDGKEAQVVHSAIDSIKHGTIGTLMQVLAAEPSEYSYFNANLLRTWAGPEHWKLKPYSKDHHAYSGSSALADKNKKAKGKNKDPYEQNFEEKMDFDNFFKETRAATTLTKATLDKYTKAKTTLPEDLHYDADKLFRLACKPKLMIRRQESALDNVDDNIENYDYDNSNDRENFCPGVEGGDHDDDDDDNEAGFNITGGTDFPEISQDEVLPSQESMISNESALNATTLAGDHLLAQPRKVAKIDIAYAKTAKKVDVKKLKTSMWAILQKPEDEAGPSGEQAAEEQKEQDNPKKRKEDGSGDAETPESVYGSHSFQSLVKTLPGKLSQNMVKNLSVPIAFVCLLHLANEKTLKITAETDMSDLHIMQG